MPVPTFTHIDFDKDDNPYNDGSGYLEKFDALSQNFTTLAEYVALVEFSVEQTTQNIMDQTEADRVAIQGLITTTVGTLTAAVAADLALAQGYAAAALHSQNQSAASAGLAAEIANIADVQKFTALASAHAMVLFAGGTSGVTGIQIPSNTQNNHGVSNWTPHFKGYLPAYTGATRNLRRKHDGVQGYILDILTDKKIRLTLNGFTYTSTVAANLIDGDINEVEASITRETASAAGQVLFIVNGAQVGDAVVIAAHGDLSAATITTTFDTDLDGFSSSSTGTGTVTWNAGQYMVVSGPDSPNRGVAVKSYSTVIGQSYQVEFDLPSGGGNLYVRLGTSSNGTQIKEVYFNTTGTKRVTFVASSATTFLGFNVPGGTYHIDNVILAPVVSIDNAATEYIMGTSSTQTEGGWLRSLTYNRAITAADALARIKRGIPSADIYGSVGNKILNSTFEVDTTNWLGMAATISRNTTDPISGAADLLCDIAASAGYRGTYYNPTALFVAGRRYRLKFKYKTSGQTMRVALDNIVTPADQDVATGLNATTSTEVKVEFTANSSVTSASKLLFYRETASATAMTFNIDDVEVEEIGVVSDLSAENAQSDAGQVFDDAHGNHGLLPASRARLSKRKRDPAHRSRHTWVNTSEEQYITLFNQNVVPDNEYFESVVVIPTGSTLTGFTIGNGSNSAYYATVTGPITAGVPIYVALDKRFPDSNRKLTIKPTGTFNGSLVVTAHGRILEVAA